MRCVGEEGESVGEVAERVEGGEGEDAAGGVVVGEDAAGDDHKGVDLLELAHGGAAIGEEGQWWEMILLLRHCCCSSSVEKTGFVGYFGQLNVL